MVQYDKKWLIISELLRKKPNTLKIFEEDLAYCRQHVSDVVEKPDDRNDCVGNDKEDLGQSVSTKDL